jgi:hypothetical protein
MTEGLSLGFYCNNLSTASLLKIIPAAGMHVKPDTTPFCSVYYFGGLLNRNFHSGTQKIRNTDLIFYLL